MTSSASPWGDQPPTTCHAGAARRIRSPPPAVAASTTSMSVVARAEVGERPVRHGGHPKCLGSQQGGELRGVVHGFVAIAVVHEEMDLLRLLGQLVDAREPLRELLLAVRIVETLRRGEPRLLPVLGVAAMEADDREPVVRDRGDRRAARRKALWLVDRHVAQAILPQELERLLAVALAHPRRVPELDGEAVVGQEVPRACDLRLVLARDREPVGVLEEDRAELAGLAERLESDPEAREELVDRVLGEVLGVHTLLREGLLGKRVTEVLRQALGIGVMGGERRERLEVHREAVGGALGPELRLLLGWQRVVRSVVLHEREASGVVAEALFRVVLDLLGIPAGCDERRVGPRARTHLHRSEGGGRSPPTTRRYPLPPTGTGPGRARRPSSLAARDPRPRRRGAPRTPRTTRAASGRSSCTRSCRAPRSSRR